jgi:hypothetical protein
MQCFKKFNRLKAMLVASILGLAVPSISAAQDVIYVDVIYAQPRSQSMYYVAPRNRPSRLDNFLSTSIRYASPRIQRSRAAASQVRQRSRHVAGRATKFYLEWHPVSWIAQDLGILDKDRVLRFVGAE